MTVSFFSREDPYEPSPGPPRGVHTTSGRAATNKFGTISHSHLSQSAAPARARISLTAPLLRKGSHHLIRAARHPSLVTGSTASRHELLNTLIQRTYYARNTGKES